MSLEKVLVAYRSELNLSRICLDRGSNISQQIYLCFMQNIYFGDKQ